ncbi:MAG: hypothetical protein AVDCRST_MAG22-2351, partial [uncultured Rubrobacteraceae bacterium]
VPSRPLHPHGPSRNDALSRRTRGGLRGFRRRQPPRGRVPLRGPRSPWHAPLPQARPQRGDREHQGERGLGGPDRGPARLRLGRCVGGARARAQILALRKPLGVSGTLLGRVFLRHEGLPQVDGRQV